MDGFIKLQLALLLRRSGSAAWKRSLIIAIVAMAIGVFFVFDPFAGARAMTIIAGAAMLLNGISDGVIAYEIGKAVQIVE